MREGLSRHPPAPLLVVQARLVQDIPVVAIILFRIFHASVDNNTGGGEGKAGEVTSLISCTIIHMNQDIGPTGNTGGALTACRYSTSYSVQINNFTHFSAVIS